MTLGFEMAGFSVVQAIEQQTRVAATYRRNHPEVDLLTADIRELDPGACLKRLGLCPGDVTVVAGGPPCQGFSESNRRTRTANNERNYLYRDFLRFVEGIQPTWFVLENVAGLRTLGSGSFLSMILDECRGLGYTTDWAELNAVEFGVPQFRRRLFVIGNRLGESITFPEPFHGPGTATPYVTVRQAIGDLPSLSSGAAVDAVSYAHYGAMLSEYQTLMRGGQRDRRTVQGCIVSRNSSRVLERYKHVRPGQNWAAIPAELLDNYADPTRCHTGIYHRLEWGTPSKVIGNFRKNMLIHPEQDRGLSVREAARLQSFPDEYEFLGSIGYQQQHVADAVPPLLAKAIAMHIRQSLP